MLRCSLRHGVPAAVLSRTPWSTERRLWIACAAETAQQAPTAAGQFTVGAKELASKGKLRLDAYLAQQLPEVSRAKIAASIKEGLILVNGSAVSKPSLQLKGGERISVELLPPEPCTAIPEDIPLDVVYEDDHVIVVNKAPGMVVHLSPGHSTGTLVNALLGHCRLGPLEVPSGSLLGGGLQAGGGGPGWFADSSELEEDEDLLAPDAADAADATNSSISSSTNDGAAAMATEVPEGRPFHTTGSPSSTTTSSSSSSSSGAVLPGVVRPGIVHRLDRGTSGLMVVAKDDLSHARLCQQFKERTVSRIYTSVVAGVPSPPAARITTNILRDPANRLRMTTAAYGTARGRTAASNYQLLQVLADGGAAMVEWRLETGRTHQIRVHARHVGHALLGDDTYGPGNAAAAKLVAGKRSSLLPRLRALLDAFGRPALHARTLGFTHPITGQRLQFDSELPADFRQLLEGLSPQQ